MKLKDKLQQEKIYINPYSFKLTIESVERFEQIADDFAMDFVVWMANQDYNLETDYKKEHIKEALEIYKKQL